MILLNPGESWQVATFQCAESNCWPQFPVTLKTRVVEINVFNAYKILECVTINRKDLSYSVRAPENLSTYHMIRNSIVKSLSNMKNKSNDFLSCKRTRHAVKHFLQLIYKPGITFPCYHLDRKVSLLECLTDPGGWQ